MSHSFGTPWTVAHWAPLSIGFPRQECWSGLPFPSPGDLLDPGIKSMSPALAGRFFTTEPPTITISYIRSSDLIQLITNILCPFTNLSLLWFDSWVGKICWSRERLHTPVFLGFPGGTDGKESAHNTTNLDFIPGLGRSPGGGHVTHSIILAWRIPTDRLA